VQESLKSRSHGGGVQSSDLSLYLMVVVLYQNVLEMSIGNIPVKIKFIFVEISFVQAAQITTFIIILLPLSLTLCFYLGVLLLNQVKGIVHEHFHLVPKKT